MCFIFERDTKHPLIISTVYAHITIYTYASTSNFDKLNHSTKNSTTSFEFFTKKKYRIRFLLEENITIRVLFYANKHKFLFVLLPIESKFDSNNSLFIMALNLNDVVLMLKQIKQLTKFFSFLGKNISIQYLFISCGRKIRSI